MKLPARVKVVEVGPRDGLQNEPESIPTEVKVRFIEALADAGLGAIEATSFVNPKRIPQLADAADVMARLQPRPRLEYSALVPNLKGLERARAANVKRVAVFTSASETFTQKNIGMSIRQSLDEFRAVAAEAIAFGISVRGYVSTCFACPYEGTVSPERVRQVTAELLAMGCDEISLGDTIGVAVPSEVEHVLEPVLLEVPRERIALHFHDTCGTALANVYAGLEMGVTIYDASAGGLGGCPYAPGAAGNLATEDLVYMLDRMGIASGVDLTKLAQAAAIVQDHLGRDLPGKQLKRLLSKTSG